MDINVYLCILVCVPWLVAAQQVTCPEGTDIALPPESRKVLWECNSFPSGDALNGCSWKRSKISWGEPHIRSELDPAGSGQRVLSIFFPEGSYVGHPDQDDPDRVNRGGTQFYSRAFPKRNELYLEYDIYFKDGFDFVRGGKLPGFYGGSGSCSGGVYNDCFSSRFMWRDEGDVELYAYIPGMFKDCKEDCFFCSCALNRCNYQYGHSFGRGSFRFNSGQWYTLSQYVKMNSPGQANGEMQILVNGAVYYRIINLRLRDKASLKVDALYFSTFFGGSSSPTYASTSNTSIYFRDFQVFE